MTWASDSRSGPWIIPYQELLGNYDLNRWRSFVKSIIPYQELLGNYDNFILFVNLIIIIPYQELLGNYDSLAVQA